MSQASREQSAPCRSAGERKPRRPGRENRAHFSYAFEAREIEPWHENGERWRVLQVTFPEQYAAHTRTQYSFFGEDGLLRRHLYTVDVLGGAEGANYAFDYRAFDGLMVPTRRRVLAYDRNHQKVPEPVLVSIDLKEIHFA